MLNFIIDLLIMGAVMSLVILLMMLLKRPMRAFRSGCRYLIWSIIIIRLCIPLSGLPSLINVSFEGDINPTKDSVAVSTEKAEIPDPIYQEDEVLLQSSDHRQEAEKTTPAENEIKKEVLPFSTKDSDDSIHLNLSDTVFSVWVIGVIVFFTLPMLRYLKNTRILNSSLRHIDDEKFDIYLDVCGEMGIKRIPRIYISNAVKTPMIYGFIRPRVILPQIELSASDLKRVLHHELVHYFRGDLYVKFLCLFANSLHWFNPLVYMASKELSCEMELSCDERVLKDSPKEERISYGVAMLEIVKKCRRSAPVLTTGFNPKSKAVKDRFENILNSTKKKKGIPIIILILCISLLSTSIIGYGKEVEEIIEAEGKPSEILQKKGYSVLLSYDGEVDDIQPFYDMMDNSMESFGVSLLTNSEGSFLIDYNGNIRTELFESELSYSYCSVCEKITDHINSVDPFTLECHEQNSGHGGGNDHYIYDKNSNAIVKSGLGEYFVCDNVDFAIVSEGIPKTPIFADHEVDVEAPEEPGYIQYNNGNIEYVYTYPEYYTLTGKFAIAVDSRPVTDFEFDGYLDFDAYGICALKKDGKWGYYNHKGEMIYDHLFEESDIWLFGDYAQNVPYSSSGGAIALKRDGKWGYGDTEGNILVDFIFDQARPVSFGKAWVKDSEGWKVIELSDIDNSLSSAEAAILADGYLDNLYYSEPKPEWKFVNSLEKEFYMTPCYSFSAYVYGEGYGVDFNHKIIVTWDKVVYRMPYSEENEIYLDGDVAEGYE